MGNRLLALTGLSVSLLGLSACESMNGHGQSPDVTMRADNGSVSAPLTPELRRDQGFSLSNMPTGYNLQSGEETLKLPPLSDFPAPNATSALNMPAPIDPMMGGYVDPLMNTINNTGDTSVTIFSLDGPVADMSLGGPSSSRVGGSDFYDPMQQMGAVMPAQNFNYGGAANTQIFFKHGSSRLGSGDMRKLSNVAQSASMAPGRISVEGHASRPAQTSDPVRNSILNLKESMNRAYAVSKTLIQKGVPANKLKTVAYGDTVPVGANDQQRRVDIVTGQ